MDVLRAAQPGAEHWRCLFLADADQGRTRITAVRARRLDGKRLPRAWGDWSAPGGETPFFCQHFHPPRPRSFRLSPFREPLRLRPGALSGDPRLAGPGGGRAGPCDDGLAAGGVRCSKIGRSSLLPVYHRHENAPFPIRLCPICTEGKADSNLIFFSSSRNFLSSSRNWKIECAARETLRLYARESAHEARPFHPNNRGP